MSKRFIDTDIWDRESFNNASQMIKLLTLFIFSKCNSIGIFKMAPSLITAYIGERVTEKDILSIPCKIEKLKNGSFWLIDFCDFQYGELTEKCRPHKKYIQMLQNAQLFERVSKGYQKGIYTLQEKEEEKEKDKEEEIIINAPAVFSVVEQTAVKPKPGSFYEFISLYPKTGNWDDATTKSAFAEAVHHVGQEHVFKYLKYFTAYVSWTKQEQRFTKTPANWLQSRQYLTGWLSERLKYSDANKIDDPELIEIANAGGETYADIKAGKV